MILEAVRKHALISDENALYNELYAMFSPNENAVKDELKGYKLTDLISKELICLKLEAKDWEDAIRQSGAKLVDNGKVTQHYICLLYTFCINVGDARYPVSKLPAEADEQIKAALAYYKL